MRNLWGKDVALGLVLRAVRARRGVVNLRTLVGLKAFVDNRQSTAFEFLRRLFSLSHLGMTSGLLTRGSGA